MGSQLARNGQPREISGISKTPPKDKMVVTCELLEDTRWSAAKGAVMLLQFLAQPRVPYKLGTGRLDGVPVHPHFVARRGG